LIKLSKGKISKKIFKNFLGKKNSENSVLFVSSPEKLKKFGKIQVFSKKLVFGVSFKDIVFLSILGFSQDFLLLAFMKIEKKLLENFSTPDSKKLSKLFHPKNSLPNCSSSRKKQEINTYCISP